MKANYSIGILVMIVAFISFQSQVRKDVSSLSVSKSLSSCNSNLKWDVQEASSKGVSLQKSSVVFKSNGFISTNLCYPGILQFFIEGESALGEAAQLVVTVDGKEIARINSTAKSFVELNIPAGKLSLSFSNDVYNSSRRQLSFDANFKGKCSALNISSPDQLIEIRSTSVIMNSAAPVLISPCGSGKVTLELMGTPLDGIFPILFWDRPYTIRGRTLITREVNNPFEIKFQNPEGRVLYDRNLNLSKISFNRNQGTARDGLYQK